MTLPLTLKSFATNGCGITHELWDANDEPLDLTDRRTLAYLAILTRDENQSTSFDEAMASCPGTTLEQAMIWRESLSLEDIPSPHLDALIDELSGGTI